MKTKITRHINIPLPAILLLFAFPAMGALSPSGDSGPVDPRSQVIVPGGVNAVCYFSNFVYNDSPEDFLFHFNEMLLYRDRPDGKPMERGMRSKLARVARWHRVIKLAMKRYKKKDTNIVTIDVANEKGFRRAGIIFNLLGLQLSRTPGGTYAVHVKKGAELSNYFRFSGIKVGIIETQLNKTHHFHFKFEEASLPIPFDMKLLAGITGLNLSSNSFFQTMMKDERFSMLLGIMYRLSARERSFISGLGGAAGALSAWRHIYNDPKLMMGMYLLSGSLRVTGDGNSNQTNGFQWTLPGGPASADLWAQLAGAHPVQAPAEFLYQLATKDNGKLNYLYQFGLFLSPPAQARLFTGEGASQMKSIYPSLPLAEKERLQPTKFPALRNSSFFTMIYSLRMKDGRFHFPNRSAWLQILEGETVEAAEPPPPPKAEEKTAVAAAAKADGGAKETGEGEVVSFLGTDNQAGGGGDSLDFTSSVSRQKKRYLRRVRRGFFLKTNLGAGFYDTGQLELVETSTKNYYTEYPGAEFSHAQPSYFHSYSAEIGYSLGRIALSVELGYTSRSYRAKEETARLNSKSSPGHTLRLRSAFLLGNLYFYFLDSNKFRAYLNGGAGVYAGRFQNTLTYPWGSALQYDVYQDNLGETALGYHGGLGLEWFFAKRFSFNMEGRFRWVEFNKMSGSGTHQYSSSISYIFDEKYSGDLMLGNDREGRYLSLRAGDRPDVVKETPAELAMKGMSFTIGARWYF